MKIVFGLVLFRFILLTQLPDTLVEQAKTTWSYNVLFCTVYQVRKYIDYVPPYPMSTMLDFPPN